MGLGVIVSPPALPLLLHLGMEDENEVHSVPWREDFPAVIVFGVYELAGFGFVHVVKSPERVWENACCPTCVGVCKR